MGRRGSLVPQYMYSTIILLLLLLWAVQNIECLSSSTVLLNLYPNYGPNGVYRESERVRFTYISTHLWAVETSQILSAYSVQL